MTTRMDEGAANLSGQGNILSSEQVTPTPCLFGESLLMTPANKELIVPSSEMKLRTDIARPSLSDRLTPLLISAGLVRGITHTSIRKQSGAAIRDSALWPLDGGDGDTPRIG